MKNKKVISAFEQRFSQWLGVREAFSFWKGRVAMYAILRALGVGNDDEVILPGYTCVMDVNPIKYLGAKPVFVDIEPTTYNIDVELIEQKITDRTKVIIAQHTYGYPCRMDAIMEIASRHDIPVVEDCCLAMGSRFQGKLCGTFGIAAYWSFQWNKPFTTGIGGMTTTDNPDLAEKIRHLCETEMVSPSTKSASMLALQRLCYKALIFPKTTALFTQLFRWLTRKGLVIGSSGTAEFVPEKADDFFMAMSGGQARAGLRQLKKINQITEHRKKLGRYYDQLLHEAGWSVPELPSDMDPVLVRYPVRVADKQEAVEKAAGQFVELGTWFECPLHPIETPMHLYGYETGMCPLAEKASREVVNLPTHPRATRKTAEHSVAFVKEIGPAE